MKCKLYRFLFGLVLLSVLAGCKSNPVSAVLLGRDIWIFQVHDAPGVMRKVVYGGSLDLEKDDIKKYAMSEIAKLSIEQKSRYFSIYHSIDDALFDTYQSSLILGTGPKFYKGYAYLVFWDEEQQPGALDANQTLARYK